MVGFQKQYFDLQKNMNSENPRVLRKNSKFAWPLNSLENVLHLGLEGFGDLPNLPFSEKWVKIIHILKKEGYRKRNS